MANNYFNVPKVVLKATRAVIEETKGKEIGEYCEFYSDIIDKVEDDYCKNVDNDAFASKIIAWNNGFASWRKFADVAENGNLYYGCWDVGNFDILKDTHGWLKEAVCMLTFELLETSIYGQDVPQDSPLKKLHWWLDAETDEAYDLDSFILTEEQAEAVLDRMTIEHWLAKGELVETVLHI